MKFKNLFTIIAILIVISIIGVLAFGYYKKFTQKNPVVTMEVKDYGTIKIELFPEYAPNTVANFVKLANSGFYDGLTFHRIVEDFMIQGGDPLGNGTGSPVLSDINSSIEKDSDADKAYCIKGEFSSNGFKENKLKFDEAGILAMSRASYTTLSPTLTEESYNSGGCQFFITTEEKASIDGLYCGFGKVIEGMDVVKAISKTEIKKADESDENTSTASTEESTPVNPPVIEKIRVDTYGADYGMPETLEPFNSTQWLLKNYYSNSQNGDSPLIVQ